MLNFTISIPLSNSFSTGFRKRKNANGPNVGFLEKSPPSQRRPQETSLSILIVKKVRYILSLQSPLKGEEGHPTLVESCRAQQLFQGQPCALFLGLTSWPWTSAGPQPLLKPSGRRYKGSRAAQTSLTQGQGPTCLLFFALHFPLSCSTLSVHHLSLVPFQPCEGKSSLVVS